MRNFAASIPLLACVFCLGSPVFGQNAPPINAWIWQDPGDIKSKDLFYGVGGKDHAPQGTFQFAGEDEKGTSPKFEVKNEGKKWKAKLGVEAQTETVATRFLWAVGYFSNEDYYFTDLPVEDLPPHLKRGRQFVSGGHVKGVRLQRHPGKNKKFANWNWKHNPFVGTREFNGLRVMMALLRNWDLKDDNNAIVETSSGQPAYEVTDMGATFGMPGKSYLDEISKNNLTAYQHFEFISKVTPDHVDFNFPTHAPWLFIFNPKFFISQARLSSIGKNVPLSDVQWIARLLSQLSPKQIRDAFRAGGYTSEQVEEYATAVEKRIAEIKRL